MSQKKTYARLDDKVPLNKWKGTTWREVAEKEPSYVSWAIKNVEWLQFDPEVYQAVGEPCDVPPVPPAPASKEETTQINMEVLQSMINMCAVLSAGKVEHGSFGPMIVAPVEDLTMIDRVHGHLLEMQKTLVSGSVFTVRSLPAEKTTAAPRPAAPKAQAQGFYNPPADLSMPDWDPMATAGDDLPF